MGGCKCSYRSCSKTSDGKTHFFHYPVRDETRCHQWMINSDRLDLNKLTPSQLKNKVVCEDHFPECMFMNYKHERLIHTAIPNVEGSEPFRSNSPNVDIKIMPHTMIHMPDVDFPKEAINTLDTNISSADKEMSTMTVNVSPITGLSFFSPHEKKQNAPPYIEILTRVHSQPTVYPPKQNKKTLSYLPMQMKNLICKEPLKNSNLASKSAPDVLQNNLSIEKNCDKSMTDKIISSDSSPVTMPLSKPCYSRNKRMPNNEMKKPVYIPIKFPKSKINTLKPISSIDIKSVLTCKLNENQTKTKESLKINSDRSDNSSIVEDNIPVIYENGVNLFPTANITKLSPNIQALIENNILDVNVMQPVTINNESKSFRQIEDKTITPVDTNVQGTTGHNLRIENSTQTLHENNDYLNLMKEGTKVVDELRTMQRGLERKFQIKKMKTKRKQNKFKPLSKASLYAQIVPFLSPKLARMVHKEMFPSMRHMHRTFE